MQSDHESESAFDPMQYKMFDSKLAEETRLAAVWQRDGKFLPMKNKTLGCEVESCLADFNGAPSPESANFLQYFAGESGYYEMTKYNVEFEIAPVSLKGTPFLNLYEALESNRMHTSRCADMIGAHVMLFGILPSFAPEHFSADMITDRLHFRTLERQLRALNKNRPFAVNIGHGDGLCFDADNLSVEGAAASLQVHLAMGERESAAFYNAAQMVCALTVGTAANSPFFMGKQLWAETRVPLFEQIMYERFVGRNAEQLPHGRKCNDIFGNGYLKESMMELFVDNHYKLPAVLPIARDTPPEQMMHLILHNRDILRWNRPVLGFMNQHPFLRMEHRAMPAGPTSADMVANMAFFTGLVCHFHRAFIGKTAQKTISLMPFESARENFYRAARDGMDAEILWLGDKYNLRDFVLSHGLDYAKRGLRAFEVDETDVVRWMDIIESRLRKQQNGAMWQIAYIAKHGNEEKNMREMTATYLRNQEEGAPVHTWRI